MITVKCPHCKHMVEVKAPVGRKSFDMGVNFVIETLQGRYSRLRGLHSGKVKHRAVCDAAAELGVSSAYVYAVIKRNGLTVDEVLANETA